MDLNQFYTLCLHGDVKGAIQYLSEAQVNNRETAEMLSKYKKRFLSDEESDEGHDTDDWVTIVISRYFTYFRSVLMGNSVEAAERSLINALSESLNELRVESQKELELELQPSLDEIEERLRIEFETRGYGFLGGVTKPFRGPYIWRRQEKHDFNVELPFDNLNVTVFILSEFVMLSWAHYATFGKRHTGGWANEKGLFYVQGEAETVDTESDDFKVWFLKHEAQHMSDYRKYPNLNSVNLEYRAKLVELIYHPDNMRILNKFKLQAKEDETLPHAYAAYQITKHLSTLKDCEGALDQLSSSDISRMASELLNQHEHTLQRRSKESYGVDFSQEYMV